MILMCVAAQEISIGDHKRISFPFLVFSRTDRGSLESLSLPQVRSIRLREPSKLCRPKATRLRILTLLFDPSPRPLDFPYFQLFWMYPCQWRIVQAAEWVSFTLEAVYFLVLDRVGPGRGGEGEHKSSEDHPDLHGCSDKMVWRKN